MDKIKIGVLSDTHIPMRRKSIPEVVLEGIKDVDLIIHAGDINKDYVIYELQEIAPVEAVAGNTDDEYITTMLGTKKCINIGGKNIGIVHGHGTYGTTLQRAGLAFKEQNVDCIVFGHSHIPFNENINGVLYFNPGSCTDKRTQEMYSYGILTIEGGKIYGEVIHFSK